MSRSLQEEQDSGLTIPNILKGFGVFFVLQSIISGSIMFACLKYKPIPALSKFFGTHKFYEQIEKLKADEKFIARTKAQILFYEGGQKTASWAAHEERVAIKRVINPVLLPACILLTIKIVKYMNKRFAKNPSEIELRVQELKAVEKSTKNE